MCSEVVGLPVRDRGQLTDEDPYLATFHGVEPAMATHPRLPDERADPGRNHAVEIDERLHSIAHAVELRFDEDLPDRPREGFVPRDPPVDARGCERDLVPDAFVGEPVDRGFLRAEVVDRLAADRVLEAGERGEADAAVFGDRGRLAPCLDREPVDLVAVLPDLPVFAELEVARPRLPFVVPAEDWPTDDEPRTSLSSSLPAATTPTAVPAISTILGRP